MQTIKVAVYGTLKKGRGNDWLLTGAKYIGAGTTTDKFLLTARGIPYTFKVSPEVELPTSNVAVEVYEVSQAELHNLDGLEGHPDWYRREKTTIALSTGHTVNAWLYFSNAAEPIDRSYYEANIENNLTVLEGVY